MSFQWRPFIALGRQAASFLKGFFWHRPNSLPSTPENSRTGVCWSSALGLGLAGVFPGRKKNELGFHPAFHSSRSICTWDVLDLPLDSRAGSWDTHTDEWVVWFWWRLAKNLRKRAVRTWKCLLFAFQSQRQAFESSCWEVETYYFAAKQSVFSTVWIFLSFARPSLGILKLYRVLWFQVHW